MIHHSQPVYIGMPTDVTFEKISGNGLLVPLITELDPNNEALETKIISEIRTRLDNSQKSVIIVDGGKCEQVFWMITSYQS